MSFISELDETSINEIGELNKFIELAVKDNSFIDEACLPLINGGKRLRPLLFFICAKSGGNISLERMLPLAAAIELIHTASLVHDDILDQSKIRRGTVTANSKYGVQIAVLIGDYLFAKAFQLVAEGNYGDEISLVLSKLVKNLCIGEITQDRSLFQIPTMTEYYYKIRLKTAVFLASCCRLGGIVAKLDKAKVEALTDYGINLGIGQLIGDVVSHLGDEAVLGKPVGSDMRQGIVTLPVIRALEVSPQSVILNAIVTKCDVSDFDIIRAIDIIKESDALEYCKTRAYAHIDAAQIKLPYFINSSTTYILDKVASFVVDRNW